MLSLTFAGLVRGLPAGSLAREIPPLIAVLSAGLHAR